MIRRILLCTLLALPFAGVCQKAAKAKKPVRRVVAPSIDYKTVGAPMPSLRVVTKDRKSVTTASLAGSSTLIVMMFNPTCGHCEEMTKAIEEHAALFKTTPVVLVAAAGMFEYLDYFRKNVKADDYPLLQIGVDSTGFIDKTFNYEGLPQVNVYDQNRKLLKAFNKITTIDSIKQFIQ